MYGKYGVLHESGNTQPVSGYSVVYLSVVGSYAKGRIVPESVPALGIVGRPGECDIEPIGESCNILPLGEIGDGIARGECHGKVLCTQCPTKREEKQYQQDASMEELGQGGLC